MVRHVRVQATAGHGPRAASEGETNFALLAVQSQSGALRRARCREHGSRSSPGVCGPGRVSPHHRVCDEEELRIVAVGCRSPTSPGIPVSSAGWRSWGAQASTRDVRHSRSGEGCSAPLRSPRKTSAPAAFAVTEFARLFAQPSVSRRPGAGCSLADHPSPPVEAGGSRVSLRRDRRAAVVGVATTAAPVPTASGTDSARPSRRGRAFTRRQR